MEYIGLFLALFIGVTLGTIGAGGAILTITVLVYILDFSPIEATTYSLVIVGISAFVGSIDYFRKGLVDIKKGLFFSFPAFVMVFIMRRYVLPSLPEVIYQSSSLTLSKDLMVMVIFALLMIGASYSMIVSRKRAIELTKQKVNYWLIFIEGLIVGALTGFVGAGGGFMIIPALVLFAKLPMKKAVGTSLVIITINSAFGAIGDFSAGVEMDWNFLIKFVGFTIIGVLLGGKFSKSIDGERLKPAFGWFVLTMGVWILIKETLL
jgi:uncharacterized membrane protein YfcA